MPGVKAFFGADYSAARDTFLAAARLRDASIEHLTHPSARGARDEPLTIDLAWLGDTTAEALLLLTSGTHGVEGFCGSGAQVALLHDDDFVRSVAARGVAVLLVHALNPYGFSHLRRVNEDNVDLNRNFRDFATPPPVNEAYATLHPHVLPARWPAPPADDAVLFAYIQQHGLAALQTVISAGQYAFPEGMFFGGNHPVWSNVCVRKVLCEYASSRARFGWIDFHSGLGPLGWGEKIFAGRDDPTELARARAWWGTDVTSFHEGSSVSAALSGAMYAAAYEECPDAAYTGIALEFGTVPLIDVFGALRADHWLHNHPEARHALQSAVNAAMRRAFYVETPEWQAAVVAQAKATAESALIHLSEASR